MLLAMEPLQDCLRKLRDEIAFYEGKIQELQKLPKERFPKLLIPYYQGLIRVNTEVIAILENSKLMSSFNLISVSEKNIRSIAAHLPK